VNSGVIMFQQRSLSFELFVDGPQIVEELEAV
jgi:hypothetical protein